MIVVPVTVFLASLRLSARLRPRLRRVYRMVGGLIVMLGSSITLYFAAYTGDQGGITAFYFQAAVVLLYVVFSVSLISVNTYLNQR